MPPSPWPHGARAAISFTMDNLGEAQAVRTGAHPSTQPIGQDPSVHTTLPRMLALLDKYHTTTRRRRGPGSEPESADLPPSPLSGPIKATYFAESWSLSVYPAAVADLRRRGHEVAWHGYQHEVWHALDADEERANFARSWDALATANAAAEKEEKGAGDVSVSVSSSSIRYEGFRPPGGDINGARTFALCRERGVRYVSPLGRLGVDAATGVVVLPFEWETVDAFWYMDKFAGLRAEHGRSGDELVAAGRPEEAFRRYLLDKFEGVKREGGYISILFHPFLQTSEKRFRVLEEVLGRLAGDEELWVAPCNEVAAWVAEHAEAFGFKS